MPDNRTHSSRKNTDYDVIIFLSQIMKFVYILNCKNNLVEFCKINSERYDVLISLTSFTLKEGLLPVEFDIYKIENLINTLLYERSLEPLDIPDYEGRFSEDEIFEFRIFKEINLKLCNTGFDNKIIFLINIYESILKDESPYFLMFTKYLGAVGRRNG